MLNHISFSPTFINTSLIDTKTEIQKRIDEVYDEHIETENRHKINHKFRVHSDCFLNDLRQNNLINFLWNTNYHSVIHQKMLLKIK